MAKSMTVAICKQASQSVVEVRGNEVKIASIETVAMPPERVAKLQQWLQQPEVNYLYSFLEARGLRHISDTLGEADDETLLRARAEYQKTNELAELLEQVAKGIDETGAEVDYQQPSYAQSQEIGPASANVPTASKSPAGRKRIPRPTRRDSTTPHRD